MNRFADDDRVAFFDTLREGAKRAQSVAGYEDHDFEVAGRPVRLRIAGAGFAGRLPTAFQHLGQPSDGDPALTIQAWDDASTGTSLPLLLQRYLHFVEMHCFEYLGPRNEMLDFHGERVRAIMHLDPVIISVFDPQRSLALYWTPDVERIPVWDWGTPLRIILNEWAKLHGMFLVHCGAVGTPAGGVLLAGKSGSGKSTAALACLDHGRLAYAADDYALLDLSGPVPMVHSLYSSAKLKGAGDFKRFAHLLPLVANRDRINQEKALIFLAESHARRVTEGFPLRAIVVPRISGQPQSRFEPASAMAALKALAPSTLLQLPGVGSQTMASLSTLVRRVPAYMLHSGTDMNGLSDCIESLLQDAGTET